MNLNFDIRGNVEIKISEIWFDLHNDFIIESILINNSENSGKIYFASEPKGLNYKIAIEFLDIYTLDADIRLKKDRIVAGLERIAFSDTIETYIDFGYSDISMRVESDNIVFDTDIGILMVGCGTVNAIVE